MLLIAKIKKLDFKTRHQDSLFDMRGTHHHALGGMDQHNQSCSFLWHADIVVPLAGEMVRLWSEIL